MTVKDYENHYHLDGLLKQEKASQSRRKQHFCSQFGWALAC